MTKKQQKKCKQCGICCKVIPLNHTKKEIRERRGCYSANFILEHWKRVSIATASQINPYLIDRSSKGVIRWYVCDMFDYEKNLCKCYNVVKPSVCSDYPYYGLKKIRTTFIFATPECGYNKKEK